MNKLMCLMMALFVTTVLVAETTVEDFFVAYDAQQPLPRPDRRSREIEPIPFIPVKEIAAEDLEKAWNRSVLKWGEKGKYYDPFIGWNKRVYGFNYYFDHYVFLPVVEGYKYITPQPVRTGISNVLSNLWEVTNFTNCLFQGKFSGAGKTLSRFCINTTVGIGGIMDISTKWGIHKQKEDFGQTLAVWGVGHGPYLVLPIWGPSSLRDGTGLIVDSVIWDVVDPLNLEHNQSWVYPLMVMKGIDTRYCEDFRYFETGSPLEYELVRLIYYKYRELEVSK